MPSLNILINDKIIKQTAKPACHFQNMSGLNYVLSRIKSTHESLQLTDESVYKVHNKLLYLLISFLQDSENTC